MASPPQLGLAFGAAVERLKVGLAQAVGTVHQTIVGDAVRNTHHVSGLVQRDFERAAQAGGVVLGRIAVAPQRPHAGAFAE